MADDLETKRAELKRAYDRLDNLERDRGDPTLVKAYRALARQLADQVSDLERQEGQS